MMTGTFWRATLERAVRTVAQTAIALLGVDLVSVLEIDWTYVAGVSATAGVLSVLTSLAASNVGQAGPSFSVETTTPKSAPTESE